MPKRPRVSVIIPTYNRAELLRLTVDSVLAQTYPDVEILVVDDGSTDDTAQAMAQYAGRVIYVRQPHHAADARNTGIAHATGAYLNFLDHDDLMLPAKIERQVQVLETRPDAGLVTCRYYHIDGNGVRLDQTGVVPEGHVLGALLCENFIWSGAPLIRRACLDRVGVFDEGVMCNDWEMWLRIARAGYVFAAVQEPLGAYRVLPNTQMADVAEVEHGVFDVLDRVFADPQLPPEAAAVRDRAYGNYRLWNGFRYYAAGDWDQAQRGLLLALRRVPHLSDDPETLVQAVRDNVLGVRIPDPVGLVGDVLDHLPAGLEWLGEYRALLLGQVRIELALRRFAAGERAAGREQLAEAFAVWPAVLDQPGDFANRVRDSSLRWPVLDPLECLETVFASLPPGAGRLAQERARVLDEVNLGCAFDDFAARRWRAVVRRVLSGLRHNPTRLRNRGVLSILIRSLAQIVLPERVPAQRSPDPLGIRLLSQ